MKNKLSQSGNIVSGITALSLLLGACAGAPLKGDKPFSQEDLEEALAEAIDEKDTKEVERLLLLKLGCESTGLQRDGTAAACVTSANPDKGHTQDRAVSRAKGTMGRAHALRNNLFIKQWLETTPQGRALIEMGAFNADGLGFDPAKAVITKGRKNILSTCVRTRRLIDIPNDQQRDNNDRQNNGDR